MKVAVIGLDCAAPQLVFDRFREDLPNLCRLMDGGVWGRLRSCDPPITVPAWSCMMSGFDPGQLGIYGFRNRKDYSYGGYKIADGSAIGVDRAWDVLSAAGKRVMLLGVPQTYPVRPVHGCVVSDFLTPSTESEYTFPPELKADVERASGGYVFDVDNFRTSDKSALLERIYVKTKKHFAVARRLLESQRWDFFMMVEMGTDRIHHAFWSYMDSTHPRYEPANAFEGVIREYYRYVDRQVGELVAILPLDTVVLVVSDHGAKRLEGGICFNEWLIREGYLTLKKYPTCPTPIESVEIDWLRTTAWGDGGYYGRVFLNVRGREPHGIVAREDYEEVRDGLVEQIARITDSHGRNIGSRAYRPEELYRNVNGIAPDLIVYFGDLDWRSIGSVGYSSIYSFENDTGPDEANHDWEGIFIMQGPRIVPQRSHYSIYDVGPTILNLFDLEGTPGGVGRSMPLVASSPLAKAR